MGNRADHAGAVDGGGIGTNRTCIAAIRSDGDGNGAGVCAAGTLGTCTRSRIAVNQPNRDTARRPDRDSTRGGIAQHSRCAKRPAYRCGANLSYEDAVPTG